MNRPEVVATRRSGFEHRVEMSGFELTVDEPEEDGGTGAGPAPTRLLAGSLASCTAITMEMYADRKGWELDGLAVGVEVDGSIHRGTFELEIVVDLPDGLDEEQRDRLMRVAAKCPVHKALAPSVPISVREGTISSGPGGDLSGRVAIVTGASRGIGRETSVLLAYAGASILLVARGASDLRTVADACNAAIAAAEPASGASVSTLAIDVTADGAAERIAATATELAGPGADILVNNAGVSAIREIEEVPLDDWRAAFELNVIAPKLLMDATVPAMAERGWGRVVNVASSAGKRPSGSMPEYSVAKAAQLSLSRLYADRWASSGVAINAVCPGPVKSEMWMDDGGLLDQTVAGGGHGHRNDALAEVGAKRPIGRLAEVEEIAPAIAFLCSSAASYVSGAAWSVDGGTVQVII